MENKKGLHDKILNSGMTPEEVSKFINSLSEEEDALEQEVLEHQAKLSGEIKKLVEEADEFIKNREKEKGEQEQRE